MGLPSVLIEFQSRAATVMQRGAVGAVALILKDEHVTGVTEYKVADISEVPSALNSTNKDYVKQALLGTPKEVKMIVIKSDAPDYAEALQYLETTPFNFLAVPGIETADVPALAAWVKTMRDAKERKFIAVLPNIAADHEGIVNFTTGEIKVGERVYTSSQFTARIAGLLAGLPLNAAPTFRTLPEVTDIPKLTKQEADERIDAGELILYHDGEKVKIARGVTSLVTTTEDKGADWKKIKLVRILDMIYQDVKSTIEDHYIGSVQNSYENKLLLLSAINAYYEGLELENILDRGKNRCEIDVQEQKLYLKSIGEPVDDWTEQMIKEANTRDKVFLFSSVRPLDAIEDVKVRVNL